MLSIIIPTKNRKDILAETLGAIQEVDFPKEMSLEIIVINDGDDDLSNLEKEEPFPIRIHKNPGSGASSARNLGAKNASHELLLFLDDDILVHADSLSLICKFHSDRPGTLLSGTWENSPKLTEILRKTPFGRYKLDNDYSCMEGFDLAKVGANLFQAESLPSFLLSLSRKTFVKIGRFDEDFPHAGVEDQEFALRALQCGKELFYSTEIRSFHNELDRTSRENWLARHFSSMHAFPLFCELHPEKKKSPLYIELRTISRNDSTRLKLKKIVKRICFNGFLLYSASTLTTLMEKLAAPQSLLNRLYRLSSGIVIYQGFNVGQKSLQIRKT